MNLSHMQRIARERGYGEIVEILFTATVLHKGWESDNEAWLVRMKGGGKKLFHTNHGMFCPLDIKELDATIKQTASSLDELQALKAASGK